jgi:glycosyltransferase A (GT-A) superfamily protein (DUF2064 family)
MNSRVTLIIFAKAPVPGYVKTRLIPLLGPQGAADTHKKLTEHSMLTHSDIEMIVGKLQNGHEAAIIPAEDGGYVLLGLRKFSSTLFEDISWGGADVYEQTREKILALDWKLYEHETFWDVDRPEDIKRLSTLDLKLN